MMPAARHRQLLLRTLSAAATSGWLELGHLRLRCAIGRGGLRATKCEGDGATPIGRWSMRQAFYRADRMPRPPTRLPLRRLRPDDGWCDAVGDRNYNRWVRHPYPASAEQMWRQDGLYDLVVVLAHNDCPRVQGRGSAIFMHVARPGWQPTAGCVALTLVDLLRVLARLHRGCAIRVGHRSLRNTPPPAPPAVSIRSR